MKFFGRDEELKELKRIRDLSVSNSRFTVITGRRRVGKTELIERAFGGGTMPYLYFLVTNRAERELCGILQEEVEKVLEEPILGRAERFSQLLEIVMKASLKSPLTLVIDEFQEFDKINPAIFGEIQGVWDRLHKKSKINLVVCGSVNRMMHKIFFDRFAAALRTQHGESASGSVFDRIVERDTRCTLSETEERRSADALDLDRRSGALC